MSINVKIPHLIPPRTFTPSGGTGGTGLPSADQFSLFDVALNGVGFMYANTPLNPLVRETMPFTKDQVDSAHSPGEQTLTSWWIESQDSFHGGAGQLNLEPTGGETPVSRVRYDLSKNVDPFVPGLVTRLPDTKVILGGTINKVVALQVSGADALAVLLSSGAVHLLTNLDGTVGDTVCTAVTSVLDITSDGARIYAATATAIKSVDPASPTVATTIASWPASVTNPVLGWAKSRLMAAAAGAVYQVDVSLTGVTLGATQLLLQHPTPGWTWRCFSDSPTAVLAAGDAGAFSEINQFVLAEVGGAPQLQPGGAVVTLPVGERVLSLSGVMGTFQAVGTTQGVRIGKFDPYYGKLSIGPLELLPSDPTIPANAVITRGSYVYAIGKAYDEGGLLAVDVGTTIDQAGRFAWAPHLVAPTTTTTAATCGTTLAVSARIAFAIPGVGLLLEGIGPGVGREAWVRTSRVRFGTTEPKLFKLGTLRADLDSSTISVIGITPSASTSLGTVGFTDLPPDIRLPSSRTEWLQLEMHLSGSTVKLRGYSTKALPGTRRQVRIKLVLQVYDSESTRSGQRIRDTLSARGQRDFLEGLATEGDEILLQEFTPSDVQSTVCVVEQVTFNQVGRTTKRSDVGGEATVILRTVDL